MFTNKDVKFSWDNLASIKWETGMKNADNGDLIYEGVVELNQPVILGDGIDEYYNLKVSLPYISFTMDICFRNAVDTTVLPGIHNVYIAHFKSWKKIPNTLEQLEILT